MLNKQENLLNDKRTYVLLHEYTHAMEIENMEDPNVSATEPLNLLPSVKT